jgi:hypothetical protein
MKFADDAKITNQRSLQMLQKSLMNEICSCCKNLQSMKFADIAKIIYQ